MNHSSLSLMPPHHLCPPFANQATQLSYHVLWTPIREPGGNLPFWPPEWKEGERTAVKSFFLHLFLRSGGAFFDSSICLPSLPSRLWYSPPHTRWQSVRDWFLGCTQVVWNLLGRMS